MPNRKVRTALLCALVAAGLSAPFVADAQPKDRDTCDLGGRDVACLYSAAHFAGTMKPIARTSGHKIVLDKEFDVRSIRSEVALSVSGTDYNYNLTTALIQGDGGAIPDINLDGDGLYGDEVTWLQVKGKDAQPSMDELKSNVHGKCATSKTTSVDCASWKDLDEHTSLFTVKKEFKNAPTSAARTSKTAVKAEDECGLGVKNAICIYNTDNQMVAGVPEGYNRALLQPITHKNPYGKAYAQGTTVSVGGTANDHYWGVWMFQADMELGVPLSEFGINADAVKYNSNS